MSKITAAEIMHITDKLLDAHAELVTRGLPVGQVDVITGCALGVMLSGGNG